jgi:hypothetical protein
MAFPLTPRRYRVEHRAHGVVAPLGNLEDVPIHHATLDPFVSFLLYRGHAGQVVLIDAVTDIVVARRKVLPFAAKAGERFRR